MTNLGIPDFSLPNIDCMTDDDLRNVWGTLKSASNYCEATLKARELRKAGNTQQAIVQEGIADRIYQALPEDVRW